MASNLTNQSRNVLSKKFMVRKEVILICFMLLDDDKKEIIYPKLEVSLVHVEMLAVRASSVGSFREFFSISHQLTRLLLG